MIALERHAIRLRILLYVAFREIALPFKVSQSRHDAIVARLLFRGAHLGFLLRGCPAGYR